MVYFAETNQAPLPYSMIQHIGMEIIRKLVPINSLRYLQTTVVMGIGGLVSEFMWGIVLSNKWKMKGGLKRLGIFFSLNSLSLMFEISQMD